MEKKNMKLTQIPFDYCRFLKIFVPLVFFFILVFKGGSWVSFTKKNYLNNTVDNYIDKQLSMENTLNNV